MCTKLHVHSALCALSPVCTQLHVYSDLCALSSVHTQFHVHLATVVLWSLWEVMGNRAMGKYSISTGYSYSTKISSYTFLPVLGFEVTRILKPS